MRCCRSVVTTEGLPLFKPPYARLTAIDMNRGEHLWMSPLGNGPRNHPLLRDMDLPPARRPHRRPERAGDEDARICDGLEARPRCRRDADRADVGPVGRSGRRPQAGVRLRQAERRTAARDRAGRPHRRGADDVPPRGEAVHRDSPPAPTPTWSWWPWRCPTDGGAADPKGQPCEPVRALWVSRV